MIVRIVTCFLLLATVVQHVMAGENKSWARQFDNLRFALDTSIRPQYEEKHNKNSLIESVGFDMYKVFTTDHSGNIGTLILQGYFTKLNNVEPHPPFFNSKDDLKFICLICNFNTVIINRGRLNLRLGHFEIPFGLEYNQDTNGTLRQYSNAFDLGSKLDWGVSLNGKSSWGGYEVSVSRGVGIDWKNDTKTYIVSGRVERTFGYSSYLGFSGFYGHLRSLKSSSDFINRSRIGFDATTNWKMFTLLAEVSVGQDDNTDMITNLVELDVNNRNERFMSYLQLKNKAMNQKSQSWDFISQSSLGVRYTPDNFWVFSGQWIYDFSAFDNTEKNSFYQIQARLRF